MTEFKPAFEKETNAFTLQAQGSLPALTVVARKRFTPAALENFRRSYARAARQANPCLIFEAADCDLYQLVAGKWEPLEKKESADD